MDAFQSSSTLTNRDIKDALKRLADSFEGFQAV
jgi:hypothetical protein